MHRTLILIAVVASLLPPMASSARQSSPEDQFEGQMLAWTGIVTRAVTDILYLEGEAFDISVERDSTVARSMADVVATLRAVDANASLATAPAPYVADLRTFRTILGHLIEASEGCVAIDTDPSEENGGICNEGLLGPLDDYSGFVADFKEHATDVPAEATATGQDEKPTAVATAGAERFVVEGYLAVLAATYDADDIPEVGEDCVEPRAVPISNDAPLKDRSYRIRLYDADNELIGTDTAENPTVLSRRGRYGLTCGLPFSFEVETDTDFFTFDVDGVDMSYSREDIEQAMDSESGFVVNL